MADDFDVGRGKYRRLNVVDSAEVIGCLLRGHAQVS
jgi:hypothetical protein